jgi:carbonic anhydrase
MKLETIFKHNQQWVQEKLSVDNEYFEDLSKGQQPEVLYIGCSDSRVTAEEMMGVSLGQVFVYRNIANMVSSLDLSAMSVINYAVNHLKVKHIVVCGDYHCGGVKAAMQAKDLGILNPWLRNIRDVYRLHKDELNAIEDEDDRYNKLIRLNVREQCINVLKTAEVQVAYRKNALQVHGWVFDIRSGQIIDLELDLDKILAGIMEIYTLS